MEASPKRKCSAGHYVTPHSQQFTLSSSRFHSANLADIKNNLLEAASTINSLEQERQKLRKLLYCSNEKNSGPERQKRKAAEEKLRTLKQKHQQLKGENKGLVGRLYEKNSQIEEAASEVLHLRAQLETLKTGRNSVGSKASKHFSAVVAPLQKDPRALEVLKRNGHSLASFSELVSSGRHNEALCVSLSLLLELTKERQPQTYDALEVESHSLLDSIARQSEKINRIISRSAYKTPKKRGEGPFASIETT